VKIRVDGLSCPFCAYGLEKKLNELDGVDSIFIDFEEGLVVIQVTDLQKISEEEIITKIEEAGFTPGEIVFTDKNEKPDKDD
jgi:mercuric ion binding protein